MSPETRELITWLLGTFLSLCAVAGLLVRFVLLPWLREHLVQPVKQVEKQVTENSHHNTVPTVLDRIDDVQKDVAALARVLEGHMEWSEEWVKKVEDRVETVERRGRWPWT